MKKLVIFLLVFIVSYGYAQQEPTPQPSEQEEAQQVREQLQQQNQKPDPPKEKPSQSKDPKPSFKERILVGGNLGASFGSNFTSIYLAPNVGYLVTPKWIAGFGVIYQYRNDKRTNPNIETNDWGITLFSRYQVYGPVFVHVEYEYLNFEFVQSFTPTEVITDRKGYNSVLLGGGIAQPLGGKGVFLVSVLYNVTYDEDEAIRPYNSPWVIRIGIGVGF